MKSTILLCALSLTISLVLCCKEDIAPFDPVQEEEQLPSNITYMQPIFIEEGFVLLADCKVPGLPAKVDHYEPMIRHFSSLMNGEVSVTFALPEFMCGRYAILDSNGVALGRGGLTKGDDCHAQIDTLYLQEYLLVDWPEGRPAWDHVIYSRIKAEGDTLRYAFPRLCGRFALIDEDGELAGHFGAVGGCEAYQAILNN